MPSGMNQVRDAEPSDLEDGEDELYYDDEPIEDAAAQPPAVQVPSYIAIIRIVAVLGMGLCVSFGLFIMLVGLKGVIIGVPILLLSIPCYYGMQLAEKLVARHERAASE
jgi:hypothetical protein